jgi:hypothetical protein
MELASQTRHDPNTGEWNDSLSGDLLWSNVNLGEAMPDVMTPFTWSIVRYNFAEVNLLPGYNLLGNICGRPYSNISVSASVLRLLGRNVQDMANELGGGYDQFHDWLTRSAIPVPRSAVLSVLRNVIRVQWKQAQALLGLNSGQGAQPGAGGCKLAYKRPRPARSWRMCGLGRLQGTA